MAKKIAIYGGSFDPIHLGHIYTARDLQTQFHFEKFLFLPCGQPVFKDKNRASDKERIEMLQIAIQDYPNFTIDKREIEKKTKSYSVLSLEEIHQEHPNDTLIWVMGEDAFSQFPLWYRYQDILKLAHLIILHRPEVKNMNLDILKEHQTKKPSDLTDFRHGKVLFFKNNHYPYSSSEIRKAIQNHEIVQGLDKNIQKYIQKNRCYL